MEHSSSYGFDRIARGCCETEPGLLFLVMPAAAGLGCCLRAVPVSMNCAHSKLGTLSLDELTSSLRIVFIKRRNPDAATALGKAPGTFHSSFGCGSTAFSSLNCLQVRWRWVGTSQITSFCFGAGANGRRK